MQAVGWQVSCIVILVTLLSITESTCNSGQRSPRWGRHERVRVCMRMRACTYLHHSAHGAGVRGQPVGASSLLPSCRSRDVTWPGNRSHLISPKVFDLELMTGPSCDHSTSLGRYVHIHRLPSVSSKQLSTQPTTSCGKDGAGISAP